MPCHSCAAWRARVTPPGLQQTFVRLHRNGSSHAHGMQHIALQLKYWSMLQGPDSNAINGELLAKSPDTVPMLLGFLEEEPAGIKDFYVRYHTVQLLTALAAGGPYRLQGVSSTFLVVTSRVTTTLVLGLKRSCDVISGLLISENSG